MKSVINKVAPGIMTVLLLQAAGWAAQAQEIQVPHRINMQSIVYDNDGNITKSDHVNLTINVVDDKNNVLFTETHGNVPVVEGAINLSIGEGDGSSGIPLEALDPTTGTKLIDVTVDGTNPFELMPLSSVPYALWAERALTVPDESITSQQIKKGSIKPEDLDPSFAFANVSGQIADGQIPNTVARSSDLQNHINATSAHPASAIVVSGNFVTFVAANVQEALQKIDAKLSDEIVNRGGNVTTLISNYQAADAKLQSEIDALTAGLTTETNNRVAGDNTLQNQINTINTNLSTETSDRKSGDTNLQTQINTTNTNMTTLQTNVSNISTSVTTIQTQVNQSLSTTGGKMSGDLDMSGNNITNVGKINNVDIGALANDVSGKVNRSGDTMTGDLAMDDTACNTNLGHKCKVDGVDVSELDNRVKVLEGAPVGNQVSALAGYVNDGEQIPLPLGYTQPQCVWTASAASTTDFASFQAVMLAGTGSYFAAFNINVDTNRNVTCQRFTWTAPHNVGTASMACAYMITCIK